MASPIWPFVMAWRDSRKSRRRLFLYAFSIVLGVAALVAVRSFGEDLKSAVEEQSKILLGADLSLRRRSPFGDETRPLLERIGGDQSQMVTLSTMALFPRQGATRLVRVRGVRGGYPYYGELETDPKAAASTYQSGPFALVDHTLMLQYGVSPGDPIKLGSVTFEVVGHLLRIAGESEIMSELSPRVYVPYEWMEQTGLIQVGSRVRYTTYCRFAGGVDPDLLVKKLKPELKKLEISSSTASERRARVGRSLGNLTRFLNLVGFVALVLGGVGVASSIHLYVRQRFMTIALLRCVGTTPRQTFNVYLIQTLGMAVVGVLCGISLGILAQRVLPLVLVEVLPVQLQQRISWFAIGEGLAVGLGAASLFALSALLPIRRISPLLALRAEYESHPRTLRDPLVWMVYLALLVGLLVFALLHTSSWLVGLGFFGGLVTVFVLLFGVAKAITQLIRRFFPTRWSYAWRQGLANLYRPHNQTVVVMLAVGLATFLIVTLYVSQDSLLKEVNLAGGGNRPNLVFFDIQNDQLEPLSDLVRAHGLPILQQVPIVTMRLAAIGDHTVKELRNDSGNRRGRWALTREYRCTYRDYLSDSESIISGTIQTPSAGGRIPISVEERIAGELGVTVGDRLDFDLQGVTLKTTVANLRRVEWRSFQPNFFVIFPSGVLEEAPQFHVIVTRTVAAEDSAGIQREVVARFPNVSAIDLSLVVETLDSILAQVSFAIRFMALFSIVTALAVLTGAIASGRYQRTREVVLLRTLGASQSQIRRILFIEYLFLGMLAAVTGIVLALAASWLLAYLVFDSVFAAGLVPVLAAFCAVVALTVGLGMLNSRGVFSHPPLEILRAEE